MTICNHRSAVVWFLAAALAGPPGIALAQNNQGSQPNQTAPVGSAPAPQAGDKPAAPSAVSPQSATAGAEKPGFFSAFGRWWNDSVADFNAKMKEQQSKLDQFNKESSAAAKDAAAATQQAMKNAADAMVRLPTSKVIEVHEVCAMAGNGAPDCEAAATNVCRGKGFNTGAPLDIRTAEKCNASLWVSGQNTQSGDCPEETVILRAACE